MNEWMYIPLLLVRLFYTMIGEWFNEIFFLFLWTIDKALSFFIFGSSSINTFRLNKLKCFELNLEIAFPQNHHSSEEEKKLNLLIMVYNKTNNSNQYQSVYFLKKLLQNLFLYLFWKNIVKRRFCTLVWSRKKRFRFVFLFSWKIQFNFNWMGWDG